MFSSLSETPPLRKADFRWRQMLNKDFLEEVLKNPPIERWQEGVFSHLCCEPCSGLYWAEQTRWPHSRVSMSDEAGEPYTEGIDLKRREVLT